MQIQTCIRLGFTMPEASRLQRWALTPPLHNRCTVLISPVQSKIASLPTLSLRSQRRKGTVTPLGFCLHKTLGLYTPDVISPVQSKIASLVSFTLNSQRRSSKVFVLCVKLIACRFSTSHSILLFCGTVLTLTRTWLSQATCLFGCPDFPHKVLKPCAIIRLLFINNYTTNSISDII